MTWQQWPVCFSSQMMCNTQWQHYLQHWSNHTYHQDNSKVVQHDRSACPSDHGNHMSSQRSSRSTSLVSTHHILNKKPHNSILVPQSHNSNTCHGLLVQVTHEYQESLSLSPWLSHPLTALVPLITNAHDSLPAAFCCHFLTFISQRSFSTSFSHLSQRLPFLLLPSRLLSNIFVTVLPWSILTTCPIHSSTCHYVYFLTQLPFIH